MSSMTYAQIGRTLADRIWAIAPGTHFMLSVDFNDREALRRSLKFPDGAPAEQQAAVHAVVDGFEGLFVQAHQ